MEPIQVADLLNRIAMGDNRKVEKATVAHWYDHVGDLDFADAVEAVRQHRMTTSDYLQIVHVRNGVKKIREGRIDQHLKDIPAYPDPDDVAAALLHERTWRKRLADGETPVQQAIGSGQTPALDHVAKRPPGKEQPPPPSRRTALEVTCPWCHAAPGRRCTVNGQERHWTHVDREDVASDMAEGQSRQKRDLEAERERQLRALEAIAATTQPQDAGDGPR